MRYAADGPEHIERVERLRKKEGKFSHRATQRLYIF
jgi:hypothetical protein